MFIATSQRNTLCVVIIHPLLYLLLIIASLCRHQGTLLRKALTFFTSYKIHLKIARLLICPLHLHQEGCS